jgi:hypothetical protein
LKKKGRAFGSPAQLRRRKENGRENPIYENLTVIPDKNPQIQARSIASLPCHDYPESDLKNS